VQGVRLAVLRGGPGRLPLGPGALEPGLAARLELYDLGRPRRPPGRGGDPCEVEVHLRLLSGSEGARGALLLRERGRCERDRRPAAVPRSGKSAG